MRILIFLLCFIAAFAGTKEDGLRFLEANGVQPGVITLESGMQYKVLNEGSGKFHPTVSSQCKVHYHGTLIDGTVFDSSVDRNRPATFAPRQVIKGWTEALQMMVEGDKWELYIPSELAYGERGSGRNIKPGETLVFTVEILEILGDKVPAKEKEAKLDPKAAGLKFLKENKAKPGVVELASGMQYKLLKKGSGEFHPTVDSNCRVHYHGTLIDGTVFDSSVERDSPATFSPQRVIKGWREALQLMVEGDKWELYIPSELAYGDRGSGGKIKPGETLVFTVEILEILGNRVPVEKTDDANLDPKSAGLKFLANNKNKPGVIELASGMQYKVLKEGSGDFHPTVDSSCKVHYHGTLIDGTIFDSSVDRGSPATFAPRQVIKGWTEALQLMVEGDKWELYIPSELAYGERGSGAKIKGGATLVFTVEIIEILGDKVPADKCDPKTKEKCSEKEIAYIEKKAGLPSAEIEKELARLSGLDQTKMTDDLSTWITKRKKLLGKLREDL